MIKRLIFALVVLATVGTVGAQPSGKISADPQLRMGTLPNGMTYYIRHNAKPAGMAEFHIVHNVGAVQEEDSQIGLAHFLEHLAFNGTANLPDKTTIDWLAAIGAKKFNAMTGMESTEYMLTDVPLTRESIIDSALLVLHDWSGSVTLKDEEIDNERGVIVEELRGRNSAGFRLIERWAPVLYGNTRHGLRNVIGTEKQLKTFPYSELRDFYNKWYRPDLQAVVIVGDFDVDKMEARVRRVMGSIPAAGGPSPREFFPIPPHKAPKALVVSDPELTMSNVSFYIIHPDTPFGLRTSREEVYKELLMGAAVSMSNARLGEVAQQADAPFMAASMAWDGLTGVNRALTVGSAAKEGELPRAMEGIYTEVERIRRHGFTQGELERFRTSALNALEINLARSGDRTNGDYTEAYVANFTDGVPIPSAEENYNTRKAMLERMTLDEVNRAMREKITQDNNVVIAVTPSREGVVVPEGKDLLQVMFRVRAMENIAPYEDVATDKPLVAGTIKAGKVRKQANGMYGSTVWTLSNGVRVVLLPNKFKTNVIDFVMQADGGVSTVGDADYRTAMALGTVANMSGLGEFSENVLGKMLAGKSVKMEVGVSRFNSALSGSAATRDAETMFQLAYLAFTQPRWSREDFDRYIDNTRRQLRNTEQLPPQKLTNRINSVLYGEGVRTQSLSTGNIDNIDFARMPELYKKFFGKTANSYTLYLVGDFDLESIKPLVEKYIGGLPSGARRLDWRNDGVIRIPGKTDQHFGAKMNVPKSTVYFTYAGAIEYSFENSMLIKLLASCLDSRYFDSVREEKGGTYGVGVRGDIRRLPEGSYELLVKFDTDPALADELSEIIESEIRTIAENGPRESDMAEALEFWVQRHPEELKNNDYWRGNLVGYYGMGQDWVTPFDSVLGGLSAKKVQELAQKILRDGNMVRLVMDPQ